MASMPVGGIGREDDAGGITGPLGEALAKKIDRLLGVRAGDRALVDELAAEGGRRNDNGDDDAEPDCERAPGMLGAAADEPAQAPVSLAVR